MHTFLFIQRPSHQLVYNNNKKKSKDPTFRQTSTPPTPSTARSTYSVDAAAHPRAQHSHPNSPPRNIQSALHPTRLPPSVPAAPLPQPAPSPHISSYYKTNASTRTDTVGTRAARPTRGTAAADARYGASARAAAQAPRAPRSSARPAAPVPPSLPRPPRPRSQQRDAAARRAT